MAVTALALFLFAFATGSAYADSGTFTGGGLTLTGGSQTSSAINVSGLGGAIPSATINLNGVTTDTQTLDVLLVSPHGESVLLESDVAMTAGTAAQNSDWTYVDE